MARFVPGYVEGASVCAVYSFARMVCVSLTDCSLKLGGRREVCWNVVYPPEDAAAGDIRVSDSCVLDAIQEPTLPSIRKGHGVIAWIAICYAASFLYGMLWTKVVVTACALLPVSGSIRELADQVAREVRSLVDETQLVCKTGSGGTARRKKDEANESNMIGAPIVIENGQGEVCAIWRPTCSLVMSSLAGDYDLHLAGVISCVGRCWTCWKVIYPMNKKKRDEVRCFPTQFSVSRTMPCCNKERPHMNVDSRCRMVSCLNKVFVLVQFRCGTCKQFARTVLSVNEGCSLCISRSHMTVPQPFESCRGSSQHLALSASSYYLARGAFVQSQIGPQSSLIGGSRRCARYHEQYRADGMRIISVNASGYSNLPQLTRWKADLLCIQETHATKAQQTEMSMLYREQGYTVAWGSPSKGNQSGVAIATRTQGLLPLSLPEETDMKALVESGRFVAATVPYGSAKLRLHVLCYYGITGMKNSTWKKVEQEQHLATIQRICALLGDVPLLIATDLQGQVEDTTCFARMVSMGQLFEADQWDANGAGLPTFSHAVDWDGERTKATNHIDHILVNYPVAAKMIQYERMIGTGLPGHTPLSITLSAGEYDAGAMWWVRPRQRKGATIPDDYDTVAGTRMSHDVTRHLQQSAVNEAWLTWSDSAEALLCKFDEDKESHTKMRSPVLKRRKMVAPQVRGHDGAASRKILAIASAQRRLQQLIAKRQKMELSPETTMYMTKDCFILWDRICLTMRPLSDSALWTKTCFFVTMSELQKGMDYISAAVLSMMKELKSMRLKKWRQKMQEAWMNDRAAVHRWVRDVEVAPLKTGLQMEDGTLVSCLPDIMTGLTDWWRSLFCLHHDSEITWDQFYEEYKTEIAMIAEKTEAIDPVEMDITYLKRWLATSKGSSAGVDGWSPDEVARLPTIYQSTLVDLINWSVLHNRWADVHYEAMTTLLPKTCATDCFPTPAQHRPITVLSIFYRSWTSLIYQTTQAWQHQVAHDSMRGGLAKRMPQDISWRYQFLLDDAMNLNEAATSLVLSLDKEKCFDRLLWQIGLPLMKALKMPERYVDVLGNFLSRLQRRIKYRNWIGTPFHSTNGVVQGDSLSLIFLMCLMAVKAVRDHNLVPSAVLGTFVDDNSVLCRGTDDEVSTQLTTFLRHTVSFDKLTGQKLNTKKTAAVTQSSAVTACLRAHHIEVSGSLKLLGTPISTKLMESFALPAGALEKFNKRVARIACLPLHRPARRVLASIMCGPCFDYALAHARPQWAKVLAARAKLVKMLTRRSLMRNPDLTLTISDKGHRCDPLQMIALKPIQELRCQVRRHADLRDMLIQLWERAEAMGGHADAGGEPAVREEDAEDALEPAQPLIIRAPFSCYKVGVIKRIVESLRLLNWKWISPTVFQTEDATQLDLDMEKDKQFQHRLRLSARRSVWSSTKSKARWALSLRQSAYDIDYELSTKLLRKLQSLENDRSTALEDVMTDAVITCVRLHRMKRISSSHCTCGVPHDFQHVVTECPHLHDHRQSMLGKLGHEFFENAPIHTILLGLFHKGEPPGNVQVYQNYLIDCAIAVKGYVTKVPRLIDKQDEILFDGSLALDEHQGDELQASIGAADIMRRPEDLYVKYREWFPKFAWDEPASGEPLAIKPCPFTQVSEHRVREHRRDTVQWRYGWRLVAPLHWYWSSVKWPERSAQQDGVTWAELVLDFELSTGIKVADEDAGEEWNIGRCAIKMAEATRRLAVLTSSSMYPCEETARCRSLHELGLGFMAGLVMRPVLVSKDMTNHALLNWRASGITRPQDWLIRHDTRADLAPYQVLQQAKRSGRRRMVGKQAAPATEAVIEQAQRSQKRVLVVPTDAQILEQMTKEVNDDPACQRLDKVSRTREIKRRCHNQTAFDRGCHVIEFFKEKKKLRLKCQNCDKTTDMELYQRFCRSVCEKTPEGQREAAKRNRRGQTEEVIPLDDPKVTELMAMGRPALRRMAMDKGISTVREDGKKGSKASKDELIRRLLGGAYGP